LQQLYGFKAGHFGGLTTLFLRNKELMTRNGVLTFESIVGKMGRNGNVAANLVYKLNYSVWFKTP